MVGAVLMVAAGCTSSTSTGAPGTASTVGLRAATTQTTAGPRPGESTGAFVYRTTCAGCHGADGDGSVAPALTDVNGRISRAEQETIVRTGKGQMVPLQAKLTDAQIAAVLDLSLITHLTLPTNREV